MDFTDPLQQGDVPDNWLATRKKGHRAFVVSDQPAQSARTNPRRHFPFLSIFFCFEQVYFSTKSRSCEVLSPSSPRGLHRLIRDDTLRKHQNVYFRLLQSNYNALIL